MPFLNWEAVNASVDPLPGLLPEPVKTPELPEVDASGLDVMSAALRQQNVISALFEDVEPLLPEDEPNYDFSKDIAGYEDYAMRFIRSGSHEETQRIKHRIDSELQDRRLIEQSGGWGVAASLGAGVLDPGTILSFAIPVAPELALASRGARIAAGIGANAAIDVGEEFALHAMQETRTPGESALRIGAGALLTGAFGHLATRIPQKEFNKLVEGLQAEMREAPDVGGDSVGAMRVGQNTTLADETIASKPGRFIAKTIGRISPLNRVMTSSSKMARILAQEVAEVPYKLSKNFKGIASALSLETRSVQREAAQRGAVNRMLDDAYSTYRARVGDEAVTFNEFKIHASKAMRRNDAHEIAEISTLARNTRKMIFDPDKADLQRFGVLPEEIDLMGGKSYFPRLWDQHYIGKRGIKFRDRLARHFAGNPPDMKLPDGTIVPAAALNDVELKDLVEGVVNHIMGTTRGLADIGAITTPGSLKNRVLKLPETEFEEFLVNDFESVLGGYIRSMAPQIEIRKAGFSDVNFKDELQAVADDYQAKRSVMTSDKAIEASEDEQKKVLRDLRGIILRATNQVGPKGDSDYQFGITAARMVRAYNYNTKLGGQTLSSFSDYGHVATRYGALRTNAALVKFLTNIDFNKLTRADAKRMGVALDWILDTRASTWGEIGDELASSKLERRVEWATKQFTRATGMATWNSVMKALTSALEQDHIVQAIQKGMAGMKPFEKAKLAEYGLGEDELKRITKMQEHFDDSEGMWRMRTDLWSDREAAQLVEGAISKAANIMVIRKGAGDLPLMMNSEAARTWLQFKSFGMAAVNRIMIPVAQGLAYKDAASANGFAMMLALGGLSYVAKEYAAGRKPDMRPANLAKEALNWSGVLGYAPDVWDPATGLLPKKWREDARFSKFKDVSAAQTIAGPTFGTTTDTIKMLYGLADNEGISQSDIHNVRKAFVPMQNVFYLRRIIDALEGELGETFDAEGATSDQFADRVMKTEEPKQ